MSAGSIDMMNKSFKNNRALLGKRKSLKELYKEIDTFKSTKKGLHLKKGSPEFMAQLRIKLRRDAKIRFFKSLIALVIALGVVGYFYTRVF